MKGLPRKFSLMSAAALGVVVACIITLLRPSSAMNQSMANGIGYWFGVSIGGALMFVAVAAIMNRYRR